jgi:hypothetical protein
VGEGLSIVGVGPGVDVGGSFELVDESRRQGVWWNNHRRKTANIADVKKMTDRVD